MPDIWLPSIFARAAVRLFIFIFRQFFSGMNKELEEAAKIDGRGAFATYFKLWFLWRFRHCNGSVVCFYLALND